MSATLRQGMSFFVSRVITHRESLPMPNLRMKSISRWSLTGLWLISCASASVMAQQNVDLIVDADYLVSMVSESDVIENASIAVHEGRILDIGSHVSIHSKYESDTVLAGTDQIVLPGLVNAHTHAAMTLFRGIADDLDLMDWLNNYIFPLEGKYVDHDFVRLGTELACLEMILGGTTTVVDMYFYAEVAAPVFEECGIRALVSAFESPRGMLDAAEVTKDLQTVEDIRQSWSLTTDRVHPILSAHAVYTIPTEELIVRREIANELGVPINIHVAESEAETAYSVANYETTPVSYLDSIGFFSGGVIAAHMIYPTAEEIELLVARGVGVVHNPTSNMKISAGISPVVDMLNAGVPVALGTDGAASNNDLDMWTEIHMATLLQKVTRMDPKALPAFDVLKMATVNGAKVINQFEDIGTLEIGKKADFIQIEISDLQHTPMYDVLSHLVYVTDAHNVSNVVIDGNVVVRDGKALTLDEERVKAETREFAEKLKQMIDEGEE